MNVCPALTASGSCGAATALIFGGGMIDDLFLDQLRREDSIVDDDPEQHAQTHLDAEQRADADEDQAGVKS